MEAMRTTSPLSGLSVILRASRPQFLTASAAPVLVGSALGYAVAGTFAPAPFVLAVVAIMALHAGANIINDYFDHATGNDWVNENPTPFSGGRRFIQDGVLSPQATLLTGLTYLAGGCGIGLVMVWLTGDLFILALGIVGVLGGFFYTAAPLRLGYRGIGEIIIALLFGVLPVYGAYHLQTQTLDATPILPATIVAILIFLVILINEFPDRAADAQVGKKTLVVLLGIPRCAWVYRLALASSYVAAAAMLFDSVTFAAGLLYLLTLPLAVLAMRLANPHDLARPGSYRANQMTIVLHLVGSLALAIGPLIGALLD
jgi:1,4-dihydroxy-2-naphthoate octaprenyltransferase